MNFSKTLSLIFTFIFLAFTLVQYNDSDAFLWIAIYGLLTGLCFLVYRGWYQRQILQVATLAFLGAATWQFPPVWEGVMFNEMGMKTVNIELARESLGLGIGAVVLGILAFGGNKAI